MDRKKLAEDLAKARIIPFLQDLDGELYSIVQEQLLSLSSKSGEPITIFFDSRGGNSKFAFQLGTLIAMSPCQVIGVVVEALSAACTVLQFCSVRKICAAGTLLVHKNSANLSNLKMVLVDDQLFEERLSELRRTFKSNDASLRALLVRRTGFPEETVKEWIQEGQDYIHFSTAEEALGRRLVDEILPAGFKLFSYDREK